MLDTLDTQISKCEQKLRNRLGEWNRVLVDIVGCNVRIRIYEYGCTIAPYIYKLSEYYANWKEVYDSEALCDKVMLMHTFGVTDL